MAATSDRRPRTRTYGVTEGACLLSLVVLATTLVAMWLTGELFAG